MPGGGVSSDGKYWIYPKKREFFIPAKPLSILLRGKMRAAVIEMKYADEVPPPAWDKHWVTDCSEVGNGMSSFKYLAPYMQRGFISNSRIVSYDGRDVTFSFVESATKTTRFRTLSAVEFIRMYLQHVLPSGFQKTRYYGLLGAANRKTIRDLRLLILNSRFSMPSEWNYKGDGGFLPTKNKSSVRKIQIDWQTVVQFSALVKQLPQDKPIWGTKGRVYNSTVNDILARHCKKVNVPPIAVHGLRHTHASLLLFAGVSIASVARRLGHASMTTTQKTYLHIIQELENQDVDLVMRSLSGLS